MMTDWLMVIITAIYVVATILICIANFMSAKATREQIDESKKQHKETQRLQALPYLQVAFDDGITNEDNSPQTPYTFLDISDANEDDKVTAIRYISFKNVGLGLLHHTKLTWDSKDRKDDGYPEKDIVIPPHVQWGFNALISAKKPESNDPLKKKSSKCYFKVEYEDLLGNKYRQQVEVIFVISYTELHEMYYFITPPELITDDSIQKREKHD